MSGDRDQWLHDVYLRYRDKVAGYFHKKFRSEEEAQDMVSQVFLEVTRCADRFDPERSSESAWVYAICRNLCNRHLRDAYTHERILTMNGGMTEQTAREQEFCDDREIDRYLSADELAGCLAE
jgi:RNA polymerase sigma factor (sigma-70 family)